MQDRSGELITTKPLSPTRNHSPPSDPAGPPAGSDPRTDNVSGQQHHQPSARSFWSNARSAPIQRRCPRARERRYNDVRSPAFPMSATDVSAGAVEESPGDRLDLLPCGDRFLHSTRWHGPPSGAQVVLRSLRWCRHRHRFTARNTASRVDRTATAHSAAAARPRRSRCRVPRQTARTHERPPRHVRRAASSRTQGQHLVRVGALDRTGSHRSNRGTRPAVRRDGSDARLTRPLRGLDESTCQRIGTGRGASGAVRGLFRSTGPGSIATPVRSTDRAHRRSCCRCRKHSPVDDQ